MKHSSRVSRGLVSGSVLRSGLAAIVAAGALALGTNAAQAAPITYSDFSDTTGLTTTGNAGTATTGDGEVLRVTPASGGQAGAAYLTSPFTLGSGATFSTQFQFRFSDAGGVDPADGITFVLAEDSTGLGSTGFGMGYQGVEDSVAIEFDTYNNSEEDGTLDTFPAEPNSSNHVALDLDGDLSNDAAANVYGNASCGFSDGNPPQNDHTVAGCMSNGNVWTVDISYDGTSQILDVSLKDSAQSAAFDAISDHSIDIGSYLGTNEAFVGFTASTGAGWENHDILNWTLSNTAELPGQDNDNVTNVPEPASLALFGSGLLGLGVFRRRRRLRG